VLLRRDLTARQLGDVRPSAAQVATAGGSLAPSPQIATLRCVRCEHYSPCQDCHAVRASRWSGPTVSSTWVDLHARHQTPAAHPQAIEPGEECTRRRRGLRTAVLADRGPRNAPGVRTLGQTAYPVGHPHQLSLLVAGLKLLPSCNPCNPNCNPAGCDATRFGHIDPYPGPTGGDLPR
jgi:hypothetical protein